LKFKVLFVFLGSGIIANFVSHLISFMVGDIFSSLGASGAIAGLIIFAILFDPISFTRIFIFPVPIFVLGWFLISLDLIGLSNPSQVNHFAHIGGYLALLLLFFFLEFKHRKKIMLGFVINLILIVLTYTFVSFINVERIRLFLGF
jgi:membrane associated rhomboid family serine protease